MRSLRGRTALGAVAVMAVAVAVASVVGISLLERSLRAEIDRSVVNRATDLAELNEFSDVVGVGLADDGFAAVYEVGGTTFADSSLTGAGSSDELLDPFGGTVPRLGEVLDVVVPASLTGTADLPARAVVLETPDLEDEEFEEEFFVYVAVFTDGVERTVADAVRAVAVIGPLLVALVGLLVWILTGRALRGVEALRADVAAIPADDTDRRLEPPSGATELHELTGTFNELLERVAASRGAQRRFIADAAHELRSPIASLRAQIEVAEREPAAPMPPTLGVEVVRLQRLVDDLLLLSRPDDGPGSLVDLDEVARRALRSVAGREGVVIEPQLAPAEARGDDRHLERVAVNLVANAVRHAAARVVVTTAAVEPGSGGGAWLVVDDDGAGVPVDDRERIFDRFVRLDDSRVRDEGGSGLGLAIVARVVSAHGGRVIVEDGPLGGARFGVWLPPSRPAVEA